MGLLGELETLMGKGEIKEMEEIERRVEDRGRCVITAGFQSE